MSTPARMPSANFHQAPMLVLWELTQACALACRHCRAEARPRRDTGELTTAECFRVLEEIRDLGAPLVVLTGGDPAQRPDLVTLIEQGTALGLHMALTPSATPRTTPGLLDRCRRAGLGRVAFSLDGADEAEHDRFRGVRGSWRRTLELLDAAHRIGLSAQVNTTITRANADRFDDLAAAVLPLPIDLWSVFFAVPTGRASVDDVPSAEQCEWVFDRMARLAERAPFAIKATEAPHYRRFLIQHGRWKRSSPFPRPVALRDGAGVVFISHRGEVFPSGFLPLGVGNVRDMPLSALYRDARLMRQLRDPDRFSGKCGVCPYRQVCGGSRARAYGMTGDPLGSDPTCAYEPPPREARAEAIAF